MWQPGPVIDLVGSGILIPESKIVLFAAPKMFKSLLAAQMACCLSRGEDWLDFTPQQFLTINPPPRYALKTLYVQCEIPHRRFRDRLVKMGFHHPPTLGMLHVQTEFTLKLDTAAGFNKLVSYLDAVHPDVCFIDPFYKCLSNLDEATFNRFYDNIDSLIAKYHCSFVFIAHDVKPSTNDKGQVVYKGGAALRGPRTLEGWFESIIEVRGDINTDIRQLIFETRHSEHLIPYTNIFMNRDQLCAHRI